MIFAFGASWSTVHFQWKKDKNLNTVDSSVKSTDDKQKYLVPKFNFSWYVLFFQPWFDYFTNKVILVVTSEFGIFRIRGHRISWQFIVKEIQYTYKSKLHYSLNGNYPVLWH